MTLKKFDVILWILLITIMRKLLVTEFVSLDGVFQAPGPDGSGFKYEGWSFPFNNNEFMKFKVDELEATDILLLGRVTYEGFADSWPQRSGDPFSDKFNSMPKYVVSKTLKNADWNNSHIISDNVIEEITKLKHEDGGDITVHGSGSLSKFLIEHNLVDEITIMVYPIILGIGRQLFTDMPKTKIKLIEAKPFQSGIVVLRYRPEEIEK